MPNIIDYVRSNNESFEASPINRVDGLVFSWLANLRIPEEVPAACTAEGVSIAELGSQNDLLGFVAPVHDYKDSEALLRACAASPRFGNVIACCAVDDWSRTDEKQFSATTFLTSQGAFIAFRSTDNTLIGWKENFNLAYRDTVPSQEAAKEYVERISNELKRTLWLGGHSKGGNLALYAIACCDPLARLRIERCFIYDAPGLSEQVISDSDWEDAVPLIERLVPEESLVGLLWDCRDVEAVIVQSSNSGIMQHSPFSWGIEDGDFALVKALSYDAYRTGKRINAWVKSLSAQDRERFVELLWKLAQATGEVTFNGMISSLANDSLDLVLRRFDGLPASDQAFFSNALEDLAATILLGPAPTNPETPTERADAAVDKLDDLTARFNSTQSKLDKLMGL